MFVTYNFHSFHDIILLRDMLRISPPAQLDPKTKIGSLTRTSLCHDVSRGKEHECHSDKYVTYYWIPYMGIV